MSLYAISDLHLALGMDKPMDIFGSQWDDHSNRIEACWRAKIGEGDTIVIPGDISWAMTLEQARMDLEFLHRLPGTKIISKGNHDYWWSTVAKIDRFLEQNGFHSVKVLKNNFYRIDRHTLLCGTRGWILPCDAGFGEKDEQILSREAGRLRLSIAAAQADRQEDDRIVVALHYPPLLNNCRTSVFTEIMESSGVCRCVYGHVHQKGYSRCVEGIAGGVEYINISADKIAFNPLLV
ncbi:MAG: metallophosphoesterase [Saccharofermentanales bacterium]|jgi:predicted phosphohydrolase